MAAECRLPLREQNPPPSPGHVTRMYTICSPLHHKNHCASLTLCVPSRARERCPAKVVAFFAFISASFVVEAQAACNAILKKQRERGQGDDSIQADCELDQDSSDLWRTALPRHLLELPLAAYLTSLLIRPGPDPLAAEPWRVATPSP